MIKEIAVSDVRIGMYITKVNCPWLKNPFWRKEFLLTTERQLMLIRSSTAKSVWIDYAKSIPEAAAEAAGAALSASEKKP